MTMLPRTLVAVSLGAVLATGVLAQSVSKAGDPPPSGPGTAASSSDASPIYGVTLPRGYRDWKVISVSQLHGKTNQLRVEVGNDIAIKAFREGKYPLPDGAIVAAMHWNSESPEFNNKVLRDAGKAESLVAGSPSNVQFMVKDSKNYASTAGWGFADFTNGKPGSEALHSDCFSCHAPAKDTDYIYTRYAPTP